ncbi:MAG: hypothetical protein ACYDAL_13000 [Candidatus Dormibacteraceae bacterium]
MPGLPSHAALQREDPMTLFELRAWLGHRSPTSAQHYAKLTPLTLAKAYTGYFARNVRAIEVLVDHGAVDSGAAASGRRGSTTTSPTAITPTASLFSAHSKRDDVQDELCFPLIPLFGNYLLRNARAR